MAMRSVEIVVTPGSGNGHALATAYGLLPVLADRGYRGHVRSFQGPRDVRQWGRHCGPTFSHLIGVGGDATLSAAAEVAIRVGVPLVPVPRGFGNVFARTFGHDDRAEAIVELIESGAVCRVDVGCAGQEIFLCHRSYGFLDDVQSAVERNRAQPRSRLRRHLAYYAMACEILGKIPLSTIRVDVDGERVAENCALVTVANVETYRGFLTLTPAASPLDGLLDICIIPQTTKRRLFARLFALLLKLPGRWNGVQLRRGRDVSVTVDGRARDELRVAPGALPLVVPAARISVRRPPRALAADGRPFTRAA
jgi:diacylglycerol kinase (ATP)